MKNINVGFFTIASTIHDQERIKTTCNRFLKKIEDDSFIKFNSIENNIEEANLYDLNLVFICTGGTENRFKEIYQSLKAPYYLLTSGENNSLAASIEILSFLKQNNLDGEIIHGDTSYIIERINSLYEERILLDSFKEKYLGVIGKPSDWLIASDVNYDYIYEKLKIRLIDIDINELIEEARLVKANYNDDKLKCLKDKCDQIFNSSITDGAFSIYQALKNIVKKYKLSGLTIRCFSLLNTVCNTSCLALGLLNSEGIVATCEGDIPAMLSMYFVRNVLNKSSFQANPSRIDVKNKEIVFAHCTLPLDMPISYTLNSHFESGLGIAIKGELEEKDVVVFKVGSSLKEYYISNAKIIENLNDINLCRTQIKIKLNDVKYFLNNPIGNHHIIILGDEKDKSRLDRFMMLLNKEID